MTGERCRNYSPIEDHNKKIKHNISCNINLTSEKLTWNVAAVILKLPVENLTIE